MVLLACPAERDRRVVLGPLAEQRNLQAEECKRQVRQAGPDNPRLPVVLNRGSLLACLALLREAAPAALGLPAVGLGA